MATFAMDWDIGGVGVRAAPLGLVVCSLPFPRALPWADIGLARWAVCCLKFSSFDNVLTQMEHPRQPGRLLEWTRIVDFYHVTEYLAKLAQVLFDDPRAAHGWQRRMRRWLKREPNAVYRILHSAAKYHCELKLTGKEEEAYRKAYQYLNNQKAYMDYQEYRRLGLPIGSGITEAACKTVFTQRFKESGMSWGIEGGAVILTLRLATMSQVWETVYRQYLTNRPRPTRATKTPTGNQCYAKAA